MAASKNNFGGSQPARRVASPTCRRTGCGRPAGSPEGFCAGCKLDYRRSLAAREVDLYATARLLAAANPEWADTFAHALPGQYELLLTHAAAPGGFSYLGVPATHSRPDAPAVTQRGGGPFGP